MIEFFRFKQIKILGNELKYPENKAGCFRGYFGFRIARLVKDPETLVIIKDEDLNPWQPIKVTKDASRFYKSKNNKNWNNLYSKDPDLLYKIYEGLPEVTGPTDIGEFEPIVQDRFLILV